MGVRFIFHFLVAAFLCLAPAANAAHTQARIILSTDIAKPGETILAGIHLRMDPEWHIYWINAGASGIATAIDWELPPGIRAGEIQWPVPKKLPPDQLTTYIYEEEVVLLVPLTVSANVDSGEYPLKAAVSWLECKEQCLPGDAELETRLRIGSETRLSANATLIQTWQDKLPKQSDALSPQAWWEKPLDDSSRPVVLEWTTDTSLSDADFYPFANDAFEVRGGTERLPAPEGKVRLRKVVKKFEGDWPQQLSGLLIHQTADERTGFESTITVSAKPPAGFESVDSSSTLAADKQSLWEMLIYAFIGGLILNIMPCVLPVIALKILGFVSESRSDPAHVRKLGFVYGIGVLVSFLALAALVIGVKAAGHSAGWGMQFGSPQFLIALTVLVTLVALSLFGLFEINLGSRVMGSAGTLASRQGSAGAFFNGVLATILATPCTAPFLGLALGFAFAQPPAIIVLVFLTVGLGLASPYVVLSLQPAWLKFLPKPGAWMERFKIAMGFPMLATAVWLISLTPGHYGKRAWWLGMFLVTVALAAWIYGEFVQRGRKRRGLGAGIAIAVLIGGYFYILENQLRWRQPPTEVQMTAPLQESAEGIPWEIWSPEAVRRAQAEGRPVLVDFTADWCITCEANKEFALEIPSVRARLKELNVLPLLGDYTRLPPVITAELNRYGRAGVPLVLVFPGEKNAAPQVLPEILTSRIVLDALDKVAPNNP